MPKKILIIRFSSFGDIAQCMPVVGSFSKKFPECEIHWLTRSDMAPVVSLHPGISKVWEFNRSSGFIGLLAQAFKLKSQNFDIIYDAHNNLRSFILSLILRPLWDRFFSNPRRSGFIKRGKSRIKRFLLFKLGINRFPKPFRGMASYLEPLEKIGISSEIEFPGALAFDPKMVEDLDTMVSKDLDLEKPLIVLIPSAAWEMKRWPIEHWKNLIHRMPKYQFVVLGGPGDDFCEELTRVDSKRVMNLAGALSLVQSCQVVARAGVVISADTGLLHVADLMQVNGIALIGPTAFGFPSSDSISILEASLVCRPCTKDGRGKCSSDVYKKCLVDISPQRVAKETQRILINE